MEEEAPGLAERAPLGGERRAVGIARDTEPAPSNVLRATSIASAGGSVTSRSA